MHVLCHTRQVWIRFALPCSPRGSRGLTTREIVVFIEQQLAPLLNPFPNPRSILVLDNAPGHREIRVQNARARIAAAVQRRGAMLIWNPPSSPDMVPLEGRASVFRALTGASQASGTLRKTCSLIAS